MDQFEITRRKVKNIPININTPPYATICNTIGDAIIIARHRDKVVTFVNDAFTVITGWDKKEALSQKLKNLDIWSKIEDRDRILGAIRNGNSLRDIETTVKRKDVRLVPCLMSASVIEIDDSPYILINARDITAQLISSETNRQLLADALKNTDAQKREIDMLMEAAQSISTRVTFDASARKIFNLCKAKIGATCGYIALLSDDGKEHMVHVSDDGNLPCAIIHHLPIPVQSLREVAYRNKNAVFSNNFITSEGSKRIPEGHVHLSNVLFTPLIIRDKPAGVIGLANKPKGFNNKDLTTARAFGNIAVLALEHAKAHETSKEIQSDLQKSRAELDGIFESTPILMLLLDQNKKIVTSNSALAKHAGRSEEELLGRPNGEALRCLHHLDHPQGCGHGPQCKSCLVRKTVMDTLLTRQTHVNKEVSLSIGTDPPKRRYFLLSTSFIDSDNPRILICFLDITAQKLAEREKQQVQLRLNHLQRIESISALVAGIAHDFNNILFPINGFAEILINDLPPESRQQDIAKDILSAGMRGRDLIKQILTISQAEEKDFQFVMPRIIVKETLRLIRSTFPKDIAIDQYIDPQCKGVMGDASQIRQVVMNLATNAYHAMEETGGTLKLTLKNADMPPDLKNSPDSTSGPCVLLVVEDTGTGIDPKTLDRIFDPYFTTKSENKGTGLGLAVVHGIVTQHMGAIQVESQVNKGTEIRIFFPAADNINEKKDISEPHRNRLNKLRVLFVDDDKAILKTGRMMLERMGCLVHTHMSSINALDAFAKAPNHFDIILSDQSMPQMAGDRLATEIKKIRPNIPIVICTGNGEDLRQFKANRIGIDGILKKPITKSELSRALENALDAATPNN